VFLFLLLPILLFVFGYLVGFQNQIEEVIGKGKTKKPARNKLEKDY
jgi:hypothetical protein